MQPRTDYSIIIILLQYYWNEDLGTGWVMQPSQQLHCLNGRLLLGPEIFDLMQASVM